MAPSERVVRPPKLRRFVALTAHEVERCSDVRAAQAPIDVLIASSLGTGSSRSIARVLRLRLASASGADATVLSQISSAAYRPLLQPR